mgnify:CR=1 FL=1
MQIFALPDWDFVGGSTQKRVFTLTKEDGSRLDIQGATATLSVVEYVNRGQSVLAKKVTVTADADGKYCEAIVSLQPSDTKALSGKYLYQLSAKDTGGNVSIPMHGTMWIAENLED